MVEETDAVMKIQHTDRARDRVNQPVDRVPIPMLNLSMYGKFLLRVKSLAANRARGVDEERRSNMGEGHGDIEISIARSRVSTKRAHEVARSRGDSAKDIRDTGADRRTKEARAREPDEIVAHGGNPTTVTVPQ